MDVILLLKTKRMIEITVHSLENSHKKCYHPYINELSKSTLFERGWF